jgi:hypothetical protein
MWKKVVEALFENYSSIFLRETERTNKNCIQDSRTPVELRTGQLYLMHIRTNFLKHNDKDRVHTVITTSVNFKPGRFRADKTNGVINESVGRTLTRGTTYYSQRGQRRTPCVVYEQRLSSFLAQRQNEGLRTQTIFIPGTATKRKPVTQFCIFPTGYLCYLVTKVNARRLQWCEHVSRMGTTRKGYSILVGKPLPVTHLQHQNPSHSSQLAHSIPVNCKTLYS